MWLDDQEFDAVMMDTLDEIRSVDDLRRFVHHTLCERESLLPDQFATTEIPLLRNGETCGLQFCLHGPRSVRLTAIWAADHNLVYFYDTQGTRYLKLRLTRRFESCPA